MRKKQSAYTEKMYSNKFEIGIWVGYRQLPFIKKQKLWHKEYLLN